MENSTISLKPVEVKIGKFKLFYVQEQKDFNACIEVLEQVRRKELNRVAGKSVLQSHAFSNSDLDYKLIACEDMRSGEIIGCMRMTDASNVWHIESSRKEYNLDVFSMEELDELSIFTRLAVLKKFRKSSAALLMMTVAFMHELENGKTGFLMTCEPSLFSMYKRLGLFCIGPMHNSPSGGYRIPMICIPDKEHFMEIGNPAMRFMQSLDFDRHKEAVERYKMLIQQFENSDLGVSYFQESERGQMNNQMLLTEGLSEESIDKLFKNAIKVSSKKDDVIVEKEDGGKGIAIIRKGSVRVVLSDSKRVNLSEGEVFGEVSFATGSKRSARVIANSDETEVILLSGSAIEKIKNPEDRVKIWQNIARIISLRLINTNSLFST